MKIQTVDVTEEGSVDDNQARAPREVCKKKNQTFLFADKIWPRGYKTCFMLNSAEHEI